MIRFDKYNLATNCSNLGDGFSFTNGGTDDGHGNGSISLDGDGFGKGPNNSFPPPEHTS